MTKKTLHKPVKKVPVIKRANRMLDKPSAPKVHVRLSPATAAALERLKREDASYDEAITELMWENVKLKNPIVNLAPKPTRVRILDQGAKLTQGERNKAYGDAVVNMQHMAGLLTAYFWNLIAGKYNQHGERINIENYRFTGEDAAQIMVIAKQSRTANRGVPYHEDNYTDASVYSAMAGECAERERPGDDCHADIGFARATESECSQKERARRAYSNASLPAGGALYTGSARGDSK